MCPPVSFSVHLASSAAPLLDAYVGAVDEMMYVVCVEWVLQRGHSGDGCVLASTLCMYDFINNYLFLLSWGRVR